MHAWEPLCRPASVPPGRPPLKAAPSWSFSTPPAAGSPKSSRPPGKESQRRYTRALGALPANSSVLAESPLYDLFRPALRQSRTYPQLREWAPVVENLATWDNLYAFWKRLSLLTGTSASAAPGEQEAREKLILAAFHSAASDINRELSPGRMALLWPWILTVGVLLAMVSLGVAWHRHVERRRIEELRQARDDLATLERRLATATRQVEEAPETGDVRAISPTGYPALYIDAERRQVLIRKSPSVPLETTIHGAEYHLFRHILDCLQVGWRDIHWVWMPVIWPEAQPKFPKNAFATHCTKLRKQVEGVWRLGKILGRGSRHGGEIPIKVQDVHFYTNAPAEGMATPVWHLFQACDQASKALKGGDWAQCAFWARECLRIDPENWTGNLLLCWLAAEGHLELEASLLERCCDFAQAKRESYEKALGALETLPVGPTLDEHRTCLQLRLDTLVDLAKRLPTPVASPREAPRASEGRITRKELVTWAKLLSGDRRAATKEVRRLITLQGFVDRRLDWIPVEQRREHLRSFIQELALGETRWPPNRLPKTDQGLRYLAMDYVLAQFYQLGDDAYSSAATKAQNLRRLWTNRALLRRRLEREPSDDEVFESCRRRYQWTRSLFDEITQMERFKTYLAGKR